MQSKSQGNSLKFSNDFFIFLLPAFFILHRVSEHYESIQFSEALVLFIKYIIASLLLGALVFLLFKNLKKALIFTTMLMAFHFFYGSIHDGLKDSLGNSFFTKYTFVIPFALLVFIILFFYLKKSNSSFRKVTLYLNSLLIILMVFDGFKLVSAKFKTNQYSNEVIACDTCYKPDVYLIIADGYAGEQQLKDIFKFDNTSFYNHLASRGFYVVENSLSNYKFTSNSMTSMFNMDYLKNYKEDKSHELINDNKTTNFFKNLDYEIKNYSVFKIADQAPFTKTHYFPFGIKLITDHTFLSRVYNDLGYHLIASLNIKSELAKMKRKERRDSINNLNIELQTIKAVLKEAEIKSKKPKFVYAHLIMPHGPYTYNKDGKPMNLNLSKDEQYIEYLQYTNKEILKLVDGILQRSDKPPVILFMSDHGHRVENSNINEKYFYNNINAIFYPYKNYSNLYKGMSNVNQFRVLLNTFFNQKLPLLKDSMSN